jgi:hypothetical protein
VRGVVWRLKLISNIYYLVKAENYFFLFSLI